MSKPSRYARSWWWNPVNLGKIEKELSTEFRVKKVTPTSDEMELILHKNES